MPKSLMLVVGVISLLSLLLLSAGVARAADSYDLSWYVIGGGGGKVSSGVYTLDGTVAQGVVSVVNSGAYEICAGFWCKVNVFYNNFLPLLKK